MATKLTAAGVRAAPPGVHGDLHGLRLRVLPSGTRQWVWRGTVEGKRVDLGLGGFPYTSLAEARELAFQYRKAARSGVDPRTLRGGRSVPTLAEACERVIALRMDGWKDGGRSADQWRASLRDHAAPLADVRVDRISASDVLRVLTPVWHAKPATAHRVRTRISAVMKWAIAEGHRPDDPAGEAIRAALPKNGNGHTRHHRAVGHASVADVLAKVQESGAWAGAPGARLAIEFCTLTATRSGEARQARWDEIDAEAQTWTIPGARMKTGKPHRVPLSRQALRVLDEARRLGGDDGLVFPSARVPRPVAGPVLGALLRDLDTGTTLHGMRSAFRSWCADTGVDREVAEAGLAHVFRGVEGAYQPGLFA